jgi:uncharacterized membrane protein YraQ (UPF0718 family)
MNNEQERLKRLRERQLTDRDPQVKQRKVQRTITQRERRARSQRFTLGEAWRTLPQVYRCPMIGFVVGVCITLFLPSVWVSAWAVWVGVIAILLLVIFGIILGHSLDLRDDLRDFMKH